MASFEFRPRKGALREIARSEEAQACVLAEARRVTSSAGTSYKADVIPGKNRAHARASTTTKGAFVRETTGRGSLLRSLER